ncbi:sigma-54-dependent Fis family transcriptional regulator [bacterium]|nr:sigma-54-dependent Fis family transcriptional regulator [bacterium]
MENTEDQMGIRESALTVGVIGNSPETKRLKRVVKRTAKVSNNILIVGETGTGKNFISRLIHATSNRKGKNFISINCSAYGRTLDRIDLFGEEADFNSATTRSLGLLEKANDGILFLDNIDEMSLEFQEEFLQILREKHFRRLNGEENVKFNARVISSSKRDISGDVEKNNFNRELYFLLNTLAIHILPLRDRKQDIPELFLHFLNQFCGDTNKEVPAISSEIFESILEYEWMGNIRELENTARNLVMMSPEGLLSSEFLPFKIEKHPLDFLEPRNLKGIISDVETFMIKKALQKYGGNQVKAARLLGIPEATLRFKMKKYAIPKD